MRLFLTLVIVACASTTQATEAGLAKRLDNASITSAAAEFSRIVEQGTREEWDDLHAYWALNPERYQTILDVVDELRWKDQNGRKIRSRARVLEFNGSSDRYIHNLSKRDFDAYVELKLRLSKRPLESWVKSLGRGPTVIPGANGDDGWYFGDRRLAIAVIHKKFPHLDTSYDWKRFDRFSTDDRTEVQRIRNYIAAQTSLKELGEPSDEPKSR